MQPLFFLPLLKSLKEVCAHLKTKGAGEFFLSPKLIIGACFILMLPLCLVIYSLYHRYDSLMQGEQRIQLLEVKAKKTMLVRSRAAAFIQQIQTADKNFIASHIQPLRFLQQEEKTLQLLRSTPVLERSRSLMERAINLKNNKVGLQKIVCNEQENIQETLYSLEHPVDIDAEDLHVLLYGIEYAWPTKPQLMLQSFSLKRKSISQSYEVFECNFTLLQRNLKD
jgi:hypothetical protein